MKQVVCYLYEYENERQIRNVGFVKCMALQDKVVFQIHGKGLDCTRDRKLRMFLFVTKDGESKISEIGYVEGDGRLLNYKMTVEPMQLDQLEQYSGVYLESMNEKRYVATWNKARLLLPPINMQDAILEEHNCVCEEEAFSSDAEEAIVDEVERYVEEVEMEISGEIGADNLIESDTIEDEVESNDTSLIYEKIDRQGLSALPQREWKVANNSFLLHGYYNYKHLLFIQEDNLLFLGVPGVYHAKEADAARFFGFPAFHRVEQGKIDLQPNEWNTEADFGYWCRQVGQRAN